MRTNEQTTETSKAPPVVDCENKKAHEIDSCCIADALHLYELERTKCRYHFHRELLRLAKTRVDEFHVYNKMLDVKIFNRTAAKTLDTCPNATMNAGYHFPYSSTYYT